MRADARGAPQTDGPSYGCPRTGSNLRCRIGDAGEPLESQSQCSLCSPDPGRPKSWLRARQQDSRREHRHHPRHRVPWLPRVPAAARILRRSPPGTRRLPRADRSSRPSPGTGRRARRRGARAGRAHRPRGGRHHVGRARPRRQSASWPRDVTEIWHLAAVYDLSVARDVGMRVNVEGTRNVLRFAEGCRGLRRHHYVSTCYVSGRLLRARSARTTSTSASRSTTTTRRPSSSPRSTSPGPATAACLRPCTGRRSWWATRAPATPRSSTGRTSCSSGCCASPAGWQLCRHVGDPTMVRFNMVPSGLRDRRDRPTCPPRDGRARADLPARRTRDRSPSTWLLDEMCRATGRRGVRVRLPRRLTTWSLDHDRPLARSSASPASAVDYFVHPTHYDTTTTDRDLAGSGIACPPSPPTCRPSCDSCREHRDATSA